MMREQEEGEILCMVRALGVQRLLIMLSPFFCLIPKFTFQKSVVVTATNPKAFMTTLRCPVVPSYHLPRETLAP